MWTSIVLFVVAAAYFLISLRLRPGKEETVYVEGRGPQVAPMEGAVVLGAPDPEPLDLDQAVDDQGVHEPETKSGPPSGT